MPAVAPLPDGVRLRTPHPDDRDALLALVRADETHAFGHSSASAAEVDEMLHPTLTSLVDDQWLAVDDAGRPLVWLVISDHGDTVYQDVEAFRHPTLAGESLRAALLDVAVARARDRARDAGLSEASLLSGCHVEDDVLAQTLRSRGFTHQRTFHQMRMPLSASTRLPRDVPDGVVVEPFDGSDAHWAWMHAVLSVAFSDHFGYAPTTLESFRADAATDLVPDLEVWRLARVDGEVVAAVQASGRHAETGGGYVRELGVLPRMRGRGIGSALLRLVLADYRDAGRTWAGLAVDVDNATGALGLYERVGMRSHEVMLAHLLTLLP